MSDTMEPFTAKVVKSLPKRVQVVSLQETRGVKLYPRRTGATFKDDHDHDAGSGQDHSHGAIDGHAWLDPGNAKVMVDRIAQVLGAKEPANASVFRANAEAAKAKLDQLSAELTADLKPIAGRPYLVFHDALQLFERRFNLRAVGSIAVSPEIPPGAKRLSALRKRIVSLGAVCAFAEPQFDTRLIDTVVEGTPARIGTIDPEGARIRARVRTLCNATTQSRARPQGLPFRWRQFRRGTRVREMRSNPSTQQPAPQGACNNDVPMHCHGGSTLSRWPRQTRL